MSNVLVIHGPNMNMVGLREPEIYGEFTLKEIDEMLQSAAAAADIDLECMQSNDEGAIVGAIQRAPQNGTGYIILNAAAFSHTSIAIRDALIAVDLPVVEIHMSNVYARENFRGRSYISDIVDGTITGFGELSYILAMHWVAANLAADELGEIDKDEPEEDQITH